MWLVNDTRDFKESSQFFVDAIPVGAYKTFVLKKRTTELSLYYALYDQDVLIAYYWLMKFNDLPNIYKGHEFHVDDNYQKQGIGTFLYEYLLLDEHYVVISDHFHTTGSSMMWDRLWKNPAYVVGHYNEVTKELVWGVFDKSEVYNNDHMHFVVRAKTIQDVDPDRAEDVTMDVVVNTCNAFSRWSKISGANDHITAIASELGFEI